MLWFYLHIRDIIIIKTDVHYATITRARTVISEIFHKSAPTAHMDVVYETLGNKVLR